MSISASSASRLASLPGESLPASGRLPASGKKDEFGIAGSSAAARRLRLQVRRIGPHFRTALLRGETGTEKELIARALHGISQNAGAPFVVWHAAAFDDALADPSVGAASEHDPPRVMRMPPRGTLFLEEISEMPLEAQGRLLHLLERHDTAPSRLDASQRTDLRMIASTCEDLRVLVSTGRFRQELHQRLATVEITVPPLRERVEDLPELVQYCLERLALLYGKSVPEVAEDAMVRMRRYPWPGNMRELEGVLRDGMLQSDGAPLEWRHLHVTGKQHSTERSATGASDSMRLQAVIEQHVLRVLKDCGGNKLRAAEALGISRSTLYRMLDAGAAGSWRQCANC